VLNAMPGEAERESFLVEHECDFALTSPGIGRFRVNAYRTRGGAAMVLRHVKEVIPTFEELGLPRVARDMALMPSGLILVCGPTGSGKTTTLAAMVDAINSERRCHILTIEDPIEFLHRNRLATISQRELHTDTLEFGRALRSGMRQDPDVILIGEIRDAETMRTALQAAETGHLVMASLHARTVVDAVNRVVDIFPVDEQRQARASIAESLQGVLCQHLVLSADGSGRTMVLEVAVATPRIREAVGDPEKTGALQDIVADGQFYGMRTFEQDAVRLVMSGAITVEEAEKVVTRSADLHVALRRAGYRDQG
jgi:twitching motility protein PilT